MPPRVHSASPHSLASDRTGFINAALTACTSTVAITISNVDPIAKMNMPGHDIKMARPVKVVVKIPNVYPLVRQQPARSQWPVSQASTGIRK